MPSARMPYFRGNLMYHRYDSNYGVITPAGS